MMYECVRCKTVLAAGSTECPQCGMKFDRPIPDDATLSDQPVMQEEVLVSPPFEEERVMPSPEATQVMPSPAPFPASAEIPYVAPPPPMPVYVTPSASSGLSPTNKILLIAVPICLILLVGSFFVIQSLNQSPPTTVVTVAPPVTTPTPTPMPVTNPGVTPPVVLTPGSGSGSSPADQNTNFVIGRWEAKSHDFYVFGGDGSGSRGNSVDSKPNESFTWALINGELDLHSDKDEKLAVSAGPDHNTMFLRQANGHYEQFTRSANG